MITDFFNRNYNVLIEITIFALISEIEISRVLHIIPIEIGMPTLRTEIPEEANTEALAKDLDMAYELHEAAAKRMASYQHRTKILYNRWQVPTKLGMAIHNS